jgi:hypothetical protein
MRENELMQRYFRDRLQDIDLAALHKRVMKFMESPRTGDDPSPQELRQLIGER